MNHLIREPRWRFGFLALVVILLFAALSLMAFKLVLVKMLPFDNRSEFQVIINMDEGTTLEQTAAVARALGDNIRTVPEVINYQLYVGTASPYNFNGLVRHYFLRRSPAKADIQVNLLPKGMRSAQSHDIAKRVRPPLDEIARKYHARIAVVEIPPGPPSCKLSLRKSTGPTIPSRSISPTRYAVSLNGLKGLSTWTGMWKRPRQNTGL
jgi:multidrug efflux pump subunit AcrB